jgi:hypothetical protein
MDFIKNGHSKFSIANALPTFAIGKNELATTPEAVNWGSNAVALALVLGQMSPELVILISVHINDVARIHVQALGIASKENQNLTANLNGLDGIKWDDAIDMVRSYFPKEVTSGIFQLGGSQGSSLVRFDASGTERLLSIKFKSFEEQVLSVVGWHAEVSTKGHRAK